MTIRFPVKAETRDTAGDRPAPDHPIECGIFDSHGYWASAGGITFSYPGDNLGIADRVAKMMNYAYRQGKQDALENVRVALGFGE